MAPASAPVGHSAAAATTCGRRRRHGWRTAGLYAVAMVLLLAVASLHPVDGALRSKPPPGTKRKAKKPPPKPLPGGTGIISPGMIGSAVLTDISTVYQRTILKSFVKTIDLTQMYGWLTIAETNFQNPLLGRDIAVSQVTLLKTNLASSMLTLKMFDQFTEAYGKTFQTTALQTVAYKNFHDNLQTVVAINSNPSLTYWASCNQFCDLDFASFKTTVLLNNDNTKPTTDVLTTPQQQDPFGSDHGGHRRSLLQWPPSSVDWVAAGKVTAIKNQGGCGSCWAFAATAAIESSYLMYNPVPGCSTLDLSEQQLLSCVNAAHGFGGSKGCSGGWSQDAINYVKKYWQVHDSYKPKVAGALPPTCSKTYTASAGSCNLGADPSAPSGSYVQLALNTFEDKGNTEAKLKSIVADRPTVIYFCVDNAFKLLGGGLYTDTGCGSCTNHAMLAVGYSTAGGFWRLKNSWGTGWGAGGYGCVRMNAGANGGKGPCGIHQNAFRATIAFSSKLTNKCPSPPPPRPPPPRPPRFYLGPYININRPFISFFNSPPPPRLINLGPFIHNPIVLPGRRLQGEDGEAGAEEEVKQQQQHTEAIVLPSEEQQEHSDVLPLQALEEQGQQGLAAGAADGSREATAVA